jgi:hypothetical protein
MAVYSASTLTVIVISEPSMVIGLWLFGLRMACRFSDGIVGLVAIEPSLYCNKTLSVEISEVNTGNEAVLLRWPDVSSYNSLI